jgi:hypothetical protein
VSPGAAVISRRTRLVVTGGKVALQSVFVFPAAWAPGMSFQPGPSGQLVSFGWTSFPSTTRQTRVLSSRRAWLYQ